MSDPARTHPPQHVVDLAVEVSGWSPCQSKRGVVIFRGDDVVSHGYNYKPRAFDCDRSEDCKATCRVEAVHAEQQALLSSRSLLADGADMLHVKTVNGSLVASGGPSCVQCSKLALACGIVGVWLYQDTGWQRYEAEEFHRLSVASDRDLLTALQQVAALTQREANYHALLSDLNSVMEFSDEYQARVDLVLGDCDNPKCDIANELDKKLVAAEAQVAALHQEQEELRDAIAPFRHTVEDRELWTEQRAFIDSVRDARGAYDSVQSHVHTLQADLAAADQQVAALHQQLKSLTIVGPCRNGAPHYCPNCDNSFTAIALAASVDTLTSAPK